MLESGTRWTKQGGFFLSRHLNMLNLALKKAAKNPINNYKHCTVIVKGGRVIAIGQNNSKRGIIFDELYGEKNWHSEVDALCQFNPQDLKGAVMYVGGISEHGNVCNSKPCKLCQQVISRYPLRAVYYMDKGEVKKLEIA